MNKDNGDISGIYFDAFSKVLETANISYRVKRAPNVRRRRAFWNGEVFISCCSNPSWRTKVSEKDAQIFSEPFMTLEDVIVYNGALKPDFSKIYNYNYALIRGYTYKNQDQFKKITRLKSEKLLLEFIHSGRAEFGIVNKTIAQYYINHYKMNLKIGPTYSTDDIHIRVHKKRKKLIKPINRSIKKLKSEGFFTKLKSNYVLKYNKNSSLNDYIIELAHMD
jgi:hypothetical protein